MAKTYKRERPKNWIDECYEVLVPYEFKWRATLGKVVCDCTECIEFHQPWYGFTYYHTDDCAIMKHYRKYPQMDNFLGDYNPRIIARSE